MNSKIFFASTILAILSFSAKAQDITENPSITSGGIDAGTLGTNNTFFGYQAGQNNTSTGYSNTFIGHMAGMNNTIGDNNLFLGRRSGISNETGSNNIFLGEAGVNNLSGSNNIFIGKMAADENYSGSHNVIIGNEAGSFGNGSGNIFLGYLAGAEELGNDKLFIANSDTPTPLIWGDFSTEKLKFNGTVGIGLYSNNFPTMAGTVDVSDYKLIVEDGILTEQVRVMLKADWADYVFEENYELPSLEEVENYIEENGHLPNTPSAKQVKENGIELGEIAKIQQEKIEELTLYTIQQQKQLEKQQQEIEELKAMVKTLVEKE